MSLKSIAGFALVAACTALSYRASAKDDGAGSAKSPERDPRAVRGAGQTVALDDGVCVTFAPGAVGLWMPSEKLPNEMNRWTHGHHLVLQSGEIDVRMPPGKKGERAFLVSTRAGTLTDWRGQAHVAVSSSGTTAAAIYEGALVVGSNGQGFAVYDGAGILMRPGVNPDRARSIPAAPSWEGGGEGKPVVRLVPEGTPSPASMTWSPVESGATYRVEVATDPGAERIVERAETKDPSFTAASSSEDPSGRSWVRVRAVSAEGIVGAWSPARASRRIEYRIPEGAVVARDGALVVPGGGAVTLPFPSGLEIAYEDSSRLTGGVPTRLEPTRLQWSPAPGVLRSSEDAPIRTIHVRDPNLGEGGEATLALARRELSARVTIGPSRARWPADPLVAKVQAFDPSGRIEVSAEPIVIETTLGLTPITVPWVKGAPGSGVWTAQIRPRRIFDPSVVRVVVKDGRGAEIGRGFLELVSSLD